MDNANDSSPLSSCSDNSDAVNSSTAMVYFGPLQSPEKKFTSMLSPCKPSTQPTQILSSLLRRSPRLSSPPPPQSEDDAQIETEQEDEEDGGSPPGKCSRSLWQGTPLQKILRQDEPSSAIANRIMRAHDNPSPPPKALRPPSNTPKRGSKLNELIFPPIDSSEESSDAAVEALLPPTGVASPITPDDPFLDFPPSALSERENSGSPTPRLPSRRMASSTPQPDIMEDLISFDRSVLEVADGERPVLHSPSPQTATKPMQSIDDLLLSSPPRIVVQDDALTPEYVPSSTPELDLSSEIHLNAEPSSPRRRSPRLSSLSRSPTPEPPNSTEATPRQHPPLPSETSGRSPRSRKRLRDGTVKSIDGNLLSPAKVGWTADSDVTDIESDTQSSPRRRKRSKSSFNSQIDSGKPQFTDSLSPESARILINLATPEASHHASSAPELELDKSASHNADLASTSTAVSVSASTSDASVSDANLVETPKGPPSSVQRPPPGTFNLVSPSSPIKLTLTPALDNPNRTPARRVKITADNNPLAAEVAPGVVFTPSFRPPIGDPRRTPARRIPISESHITEVDKRSKSPGPSHPSPIKLGSANLRIDDQITGNSTATTNAKVGSLAKATTLDKRPAMANDGTAYHFAQKAASKSSSTAPGGFSASRRVPAIPQPGSRIPRIGTAPKLGLPARSSKLPMPSSRNLNVPNGQPSRLPSPVKPAPKPLRRANSSSGSDDSSSGSSSQWKGPLSGSLKTINTSANSQAMQSSKRVTPPRPIKARLVVPGMFGGPTKKPTPHKSNEEQPKFSSPTKPVAIKPREVIKGTLNNFELRAPSSKLIQSREKELAVAAEALAVTTTSSKVEPQSSIHGPSLDAFTFNCPVPQRDNDAMDVDTHAGEADTATNRLMTFGDIDVTPENIVVAEDIPDSKPVGSRRSSRTRKPVSTDVFGIVTPITGTARSSAPRQKPGKGPPQASAPGNIVFFTNGTALKNLTNNNTTRNQRYHATLETLIVRKPGDRPESPTMKLRTIAEKQKEEQTRMRAERARRRQMGDWTYTDGESSMDVDIASLAPPEKHHRAPGDEEDYVTPLRPDNAGKRVKWDRGLETAIYLDEITLQPGRRKIAEKVAPSKGCLVFDPVRAPIDDLGNAINANSPLKLAPDKVVVTKYVYDNDALVEEIEPPRTTRSKSKRKA